MTPFEKYAKILLIELEDLGHQLSDLIDHYSVPDKKEGRTDRVCVGNQIVYRREERGITAMMEIVNGLDLASYAEIDDMVDDLKTHFKADLKARDLPMATYMFTEGRLNAVREYIKAG